MNENKKVIKQTFKIELSELMREDFKRIIKLLNKYNLDYDIFEGCEGGINEGR